MMGVSLKGNAICRDSESPSPVLPPALTVSTGVATAGSWGSSRLLRAVLLFEALGGSGTDSSTFSSEVRVLPRVALALGAGAGAASAGCADDLLRVGLLLVVVVAIGSSGSLGAGGDDARFLPPPVDLPRPVDFLDEGALAAAGASTSLGAGSVSEEVLTRLEPLVK